MKKRLIIAALAAAGVVAYLLNRKKTPGNKEPIERKRHLTQAFSKAKQHAINA